MRSFVRRNGRLTPAQRHALERHYPRYGLDPNEDSPIDYGRVFGRRAERVLEIGFGNGESLLAQAQAEPGADFLGVEVHRPGVGHLLHRLAEAEPDNLRVLCDDAAEVLRRRLADAALDRVQIFFPDPWPKKRHHKRRLIQPEFVALLARRIAPGGKLHLATDWQPYAEQIRAVLESDAGFEDAPSETAAATRPPTKFERRGLGRGHSVTDLVFRRV